MCCQDGNDNSSTALIKPPPAPKCTQSKQKILLFPLIFSGLANCLPGKHNYKLAINKNLFPKVSIVIIAQRIRLQTAENY